MHDRNAGDFDRRLGARSEVIYTIMSDEQQRQRLQNDDAAAP